MRQHGGGNVGVDAARAVVDTNRYMTLATADPSGRPWISPVWYASIEYRDFLWVSSPLAQHSRNIAARRDVAIVIFDSNQDPGDAQAVYLSAVAELVPEAELDECIAVYSGVSRQQGLSAWVRADVVPPARHRMYRAIANEHFVLDATDQRIAVDITDA